MRLIFSLLLSGCAAISAGAQDALQSDPNAKNPAPPNEARVHPTRIKLGGAVAAAALVDRVAPVYPPLARQTRVSGTVKLHAVVSKDGAVQQLEVLSGHPLLVPSALDAVRQWKYRPTLLNGEPVEVDTTIDVIYSLSTDTPPKAPGAPIDPQFRADVLNLLEVTHARDRSADAGRSVFESMRGQMFQNIQDEGLRTKITDAYLEKLLRIFRSEEYGEGIVVAYSKYFNDDDVKDLTKFYQTPTGQKFNNALPQLMADLMGLGQRMAKESLPAIIKEMCQEYPSQLGGQLPDCPAPDQDKKSQLLPEPAKPLEEVRPAIWPVQVPSE